MILFALTIRYYNRLSNFNMFLEVREWLVLIGGAIVIFVSFIWDYMAYVVNNYSKSADTIFDNLETITLNYTPQGFNWWIYLFGILLLLFSLSMIYRRNKKLYIKT